MRSHEGPERHQGHRSAVGSPLWIHMTAVTARARAVFAWRTSGWPGGTHQPGAPSAVLGARGAGRGRRDLADRHAGPVRPGRARRRGHVQLRRAAVLGVPGRRPAAGVRHGLSSALAKRKAPHRVAFNAAQLTLSLGAAGLVIAAARLHPSTRPTRGCRTGRACLAWRWPRSPTSSSTTCWSAPRSRCTRGPRTSDAARERCPTRPSSTRPAGDRAAGRGRDEPLAAAPGAVRVPAGGDLRQRRDLGAARAPGPP